MNIEGIRTFWSKVSIGDFVEIDSKKEFNGDIVTTRAYVGSLEVFRVGLTSKEPTPNKKVGLEENIFYSNICRYEVKQ